MARRDSPHAGGVNYDPETETYTTTHDWEESEAPSWNVIETVAAATGTDPVDMQPLYDVVDLDALDDLFESKIDSSGGRPNGRVTFRYEGCDVTIEAAGRTIVSPPAGERQ